MRTVQLTDRFSRLSTGLTAVWAPFKAAAFSVFSAAACRAILVCGWQDVSGVVQGTDGERLRMDMTGIWEHLWWQSYIPEGGLLLYMSVPSLSSRAELSVCLSFSLSRSVSISLHSLIATTSSNNSYRYFLSSLPNLFIFMSPSHPSSFPVTLYVLQCVTLIWYPSNPYVFPLSLYPSFAFFVITIVIREGARERGERGRDLIKFRSLLWDWEAGLEHGSAVLSQSH